LRVILRAPPTEESVRRALRSVIDPELGIDVVELGLVGGIWIQDRNVRVALGSTSPLCPLAETMREDAEASIRIHVPSVGDVRIERSDEPWSPDRMTDRARAALGIQGGST
jgi:metal-sulfur cluster biosynthetic enzyme